MRFSRTRSSTLEVPAFTLREILVIVIVISIGILAIVSLLTYGVGFVQKSRQKVIAVNLAREGIEAVYQIRNTNWQRRAGRKDQCWLKINPLDYGSNVDCYDDPRMVSGSYILDVGVLSGQQYFLLTGYSATGQLDLGQGISSGVLTYSLCQTGGWRYSCPGIDYPSPEGRYFREIRAYGLFTKDSAFSGGSALLCSSGLDYPTCGSPTAKEFRFCSRVVYVGYGTGIVELCGLLTNFALK